MTKKQYFKKIVSDIETGKVLRRSGGFEWIGAVAQAMGVRFPSVRTSTFIGPLPANATETLVLTTSPLNISLDNADVFILFSAYIVTGTGTTSVGYRVRRGTLVTSPQVAGNRALTATAGTDHTVNGVFFDVPGAIAGQQYSLTIQQVNATAAGTWNDGALIAFAL